MPERIVVPPRVPLLVAFTLAREGVISKHVVEPSGQISSARISATLGHLKLAEDCDEVTQRMGASRYCAPRRSENEVRLSKSGTSTYFCRWRTCGVSRARGYSASVL